MVAERTQRGDPHRLQHVTIRQPMRNSGAMTAAGRILPRMVQVMIFFLSEGRVRSMKIRSRFGGQGFGAGWVDQGDQAQQLELAFYLGQGVGVR